VNTREAVVALFVSWGRTRQKVCFGLYKPPAWPHHPKGLFVRSNWGEIVPSTVLPFVALPANGTTSLWQRIESQLLQPPESHVPTHTYLIRLNCGLYQRRIFHVLFMTLVTSRVPLLFFLWMLAACT
jgi:hypothetical protein